MGIGLAEIAIVALLSYAPLFHALGQRYLFIGTGRLGLLVMFGCVIAAMVQKVKTLFA